jgi:hypothetical protein
MLKGIPDKRQDKNTTSLKFKEDVIKYFKSKKLDLCIEIGTNKGWTTRILSMLFNKVITLEYDTLLIHEAQKNNKDRDNIEYLNGDVYNSDWGINELADVAMVDCVHAYKNVKQDIENCLKHGVKYLIFDDYGLPESEPAVKVAVDEFIKDNPGVTVTYIGEPKGSEPRRGRPLVDWEGVIICMI